MPQMSTCIVHLWCSHSLVAWVSICQSSIYRSIHNTCTQILWQLIFNWKVHTVLRLGQLVWPDSARRHEAHCAHLWGKLWRPFNLSFVGSVGANRSHNQCRAVLHFEITIFRYTTRVYGSCLHNGGPPQWRAITQVTGKVSFFSILTDLWCFGSSWHGFTLFYRVNLLWSWKFTAFCSPISGTCGWRSLSSSSRNTNNWPPLQ